MNTFEIIKSEFEKVADAVLKAGNAIDENYEKAVELIYNCKGHVIVAGIGKTGIIGRKMAATLTSTGTTAVFLHAAEGIHGDLGIITENDVIIAISYSGNSSELVSLIPFFKLRKCPIIAFTGNADSKLAKNSDVFINCRVDTGLEPFDLVPTVSTTLTLAACDAVAVAVLKKKNFEIHDFALFHPGGTIGKKLLLKVDDLMHSGEKNPVIDTDASLHDVILKMSSPNLGCTNVIDKEGKLVGIITDGDLRRMLVKNPDLNTVLAESIMTKNPKTGFPGMLAVEALNLMEKYKITMLPIVCDDKKPAGMLHMHDLINAGVVG
ncbi:MAG: D-arabinose 5-phosphate isomerase [Candidatus Cloacimonadota bacterium]|nr:MAG: D-arabinose 5-phosphate isomerase [Candidatus Cloacimonadota bacterium]